MKQFDSQLTFRNAGFSDIEAITEIYNEAILTTTATFDTIPKSVSERIVDIRPGFCVRCESDGSINALRKMEAVSNYFCLPGRKALNGRSSSDPSHNGFQNVCYVKEFLHA